MSRATPAYLKMHCDIKESNMGRATPAHCKMKNDSANERWAKRKMIAKIKRWAKIPVKSNSSPS
jgi:hypothetical protein